MAQRPKPQIDRSTGPVLKELREQYWGRMSKTRQAANDARTLLADRLGITVAETVKLAGAENWVARLPHQLTGPQRVRQQAIAKQTRLKRSVTAGGYSAQSVSTRLEQPLNAIMRHDKAGFPKADVLDNLLFEGLCFGTVSTPLSDWRWSEATLYDRDGSVAKRFRIDAKGRMDGESEYGGLDLSRATAAVEAERHDFLARHLPFRQNAHSIRNCAPIWGKDHGPDGPNLEGLIVETWWTVTELHREGVLIGKQKDGSDAQWYPLGAIGQGDSSTGGGTGKQVRVIEAWLSDTDGGPYVSRWVDDPRCGEYVFTETKDGDLAPWVTDLAALCKDKAGKPLGFSQLPISHGWGLGWSSADVDDRALTFTAPFAQGWRNINSKLTAINTWTQLACYPPLIEKLPFGGPDDEGLDGEQLAAPDFQPGKLTRVRGEVYEMVLRGPGPAVMETMQIEMGENKVEMPGSGKDGAQSGYAMTLAQAFESDALTTVTQSERKMQSMHGSLILEGAKFLGEAYEPIRVYEIAEVLIEQAKPSPTRQLLTLDPALIGDSYDVEAIERKVPGQNPALTQQRMGQVEAGMMSLLTFFEEEGYESPEDEVAKIKYEKILDSEPGMATVLRLLEQTVSDRFVEQLQKAISQGQANPQTGLPVGLVDGLNGPPQMMAPQVGQQLAPGQGPGPGVPGLGSPDPAQASLMGAVAGGLQTGPIQQSLAAGGQLPQTPLQGPLR